MSRALAAIAARMVGRRVAVSCPGCGHTRAGTVTRVTSAGMTVALPGLTHREVTLTD